MFKRRRTVKIWPNTYLKFGGGKRYRVSTGTGEAGSHLFTGLIPNVITAVVVIVVLLLVLRAFLR